MALSDTANDASLSRKNRSICGTNPDVLTVTLLRENPNPLGSNKIDTAFNTSSTLCSGSPMPMKTTFDTSLAPTIRLACTTCSTICAALRFFLNPIFAV